MTLSPRPLRSALALLLTGVWIAVFSPPACAADVASPPDNARIVTSVLEIPFRWEGAGKAWRVDVYAQGRPFCSTTVTTRSVSLRLAPGPLYQWRVVSLDAGGSRECVSARSFQISQELEFKCNGTPGAAATWRGATGGRGGDGQAVTVTLQPAGDYVRLRVAGYINGPEVLMPRSSGPVTISTCGGPGGDGAPGEAGASASGNVVYDRNGEPHELDVPGGPGGRGGDGGAGGDGGVVTVVAPGVEWARFVNVVMDPGPGGSGGCGGSGGSPSGNGSQGADGPSGNSGPSGNGGTVHAR